MRTIKFRGKDLKTGKWVYGDLHTLCDEPHIHTEPTHFPYAGKRSFIDPETVGQFTSLFDKNKKEIYEGDILRINDDEKGTIEVRFVRGVFAFLWNGDLDDELPINAPTHEWAEIIGNIHDNPELLKGGAK